MKLAIVGGRNFSDWNRFTQEMECLNIVATTVVSGGASGADTLAEQWAHVHNLPLEIHEAQWQLHGRGAGPIRNKKIVDSADMVVAFWDGSSKGTKSTISLARKAGKKVHVVRVDMPYSG